MKKIKLVAVSGYFDPIHIGHIRYLAKARQLGDYLVVILSTDEQCKKKKGYVFMPYEERKEILESIAYVNLVVPNIDKDNTCAKSFDKLRPNIFAKGGDRTSSNMPKAELDICKKRNIKIVYNVGGGKIQSSSWLIGKVKKNEKTN